MKRRAKFIITGVFLFIISLVIMGECILRSKGFSYDSIIYNIHIKPGHLFSPDSLLGWNIKEGTYNIYVRDTSIRFTATVDKEKNRITYNEIDSSRYSDLPVIQIYGCSCTFGFSVADSLTESWQLQTLMPNFKIENKGIPGYGLTQMLLLLKKSLADGDTPKIAVINYAHFLDVRIPMSKIWSSGIVSHGLDDGIDNLNLPYYSFENGDAHLNCTPYNKLTRFWPLASKLSLVFLANVIYDNSKDDKRQKEFSDLAYKTVLEMLKYCDKNHIVPIFATFDTEIDPDSTFDNITGKGYFTLKYGVNLGDNKYNSAPYDPSHPNALAHHIFAQKLYQFIVSKGLDK